MGSERIGNMFRRCRGEGRLAIVAYLMSGFPSPAAFPALARAVAEAGADAIELGIPFSDPLADGPTIQAAGAAALKAGVTTAGCLEMAAQVRQATQGSRPDLVLLFMGYFNPILQYGPARFAADSRAAGVDGLIVPDLALEEAPELDVPCREHGLGIVPLVAPTSATERIRALAARGAALLYVTSRLGVTGARSDLPLQVPELVARVRSALSEPLPLAVGFGISRPEHVAALHGLADAAVVGSALLDRVGRAEDPVGAAAEFIAGLRQAAG